MSDFIAKINLKAEFDEASELEDHEPLTKAIIDKTARKLMSDLKKAKEYYKTCPRLSKDQKEYCDEEVDITIQNLEEFIECWVDDPDPDMSDMRNEWHYFFNGVYDWADISLDNKFGGKKMAWVKTGEI